MADPYEVFLSIVDADSQPDRAPERRDATEEEIRQAREELRKLAENGQSALTIDFEQEDDESELEEGEGQAYEEQHPEPSTGRTKRKIRAIIRRIIFGIAALLFITLCLAFTAVYAERNQARRAYDTDTIWVERAKSSLREVEVLLKEFVPRGGQTKHSITDRDVKKLYETIKRGQTQLEELQRHPVYFGDKSKFLTDVTYKDYSDVPAGERFIKKWKIQNVGSVPWKGRFLMREGPPDAPGKIKSDKRIPIPVMQPNEIRTLSVELQAPEETGLAYAEWKMVDENGRYLIPAQQPLFVLVHVAQKQ